MSAIINIRSDKSSHFPTWHPMVGHTMAWIMHFPSKEMRNHKAAAVTGAVEIQKWEAKHPDTKKKSFYITVTEYPEKA